MLIGSGEAGTVLLVAGDELTPTLRATLGRMGMGRVGVAPSEGAAAILFGREGGMGAVENLTPTTTDHPVEKSDWAYPTASVMRLIDTIAGGSTAAYETSGAKCIIRL